MLHINFVTYKECLYKECHGTVVIPQNVKKVKITAPYCTTTLGIPPSNPDPVPVTCRTYSNLDEDEIQPVLRIFNLRHNIKKMSRLVYNAFLFFIQKGNSSSQS